MELKYISFINIIDVLPLYESNSLNFSIHFRSFVLTSENYILSTSYEFRNLKNKHQTCIPVISSLVNITRILTPEQYPSIQQCQKFFKYKYCLGISRQTAEVKCQYNISYGCTVFINNIAIDTFRIFPLPYKLYNLPLSSTTL